MSTLEFSKKDNYTRCKNSAIYSLAMREHSRKELYQKLENKDFSAGVDLNQLLNELEEKNYLCERRFVESFIRYRASRGQGPVKISSELNQRGITNSMINEGLESTEVDWSTVAKEQLEKKYGLAKANDYREKTKRMRFLSTRGFRHDEIYRVVT